MATYLPFKVDLSGKVAVVTGGSGVLCSGFARALGACGASVAVLGRRLDAAQKVADDIIAEGGKAIAISADVMKKESLMAARETVLSTFGPCDILINGAGGNNPKGTTSKEYLFSDDLKNKAADVVTFFDLDLDGLRYVMDLNFLGTLLPTQVFAPDMADRPGTTVLNVSSMNAFRPLTKIPAYSAAKAAVSNFTQWLAVHFSKTGIRCNAIAPGFFSTAQNAALLWNPDGSPTARTGKILNATPMGRFGVPQELIGALLFLTDERSSGFITGVVLPVDGGFSAYSGV